VGGHSLANAVVRDFAMAHGTLVAEVGDPQGPGYYATIIRIVR